MENTKALTAALSYAARGWAIFPTKPRSKQPATPHGFKDATKDPDRIKTWYTGDSRGIAIATGAASALVVIDIDEDAAKGKHGLAVLAEWEEQHGKLPRTVTARTGRGGLHLYYHNTGAEIGSRAGLYEGVDVRGEGGYVIAPPTVHPNGRAYSWEISPEDMEPAELDGRVLQFLEGGEPDAFDRLADAPEHYKLPDDIPQGTRTEELVRYLGSLQALGYSDDDIIDKIRDANASKCSPPLSDKELEREVLPALKRWEKGSRTTAPAEELGAVVSKLQEQEAARKYPRTDKGISRLFSDIYAERHRYCPQWRTWAFFDGVKWSKDLGGLAARHSIKAFTDALMLYAPLAGLPDEEAVRYRKYVAGLGSYRARNIIINDAVDDNPLDASNLDAEPFLFNTVNGVLDLRHGVEFTGHKPELLQGKAAAVIYDPAATCPEWEQFLAEIMEDDTEKIQFLQKFAGLSLTGDTREETMLILYGQTTRNGKSTYVETLAAMYGDYAVNMDPATLAKRERDTRSASGDLARLAGARYVVTSEPPKGMLFDAAKLKAMLGRDTITARALYESEIEFIPQFKIVMNTNYLPQIGDPSIFTSGRVHVVTFDRHFTPEEQDRTLKERLRKPAELSGILNWCIAGLQRYRREGLKPPAAVLKATREYQETSDRIKAFFDDCMVFSPDENTPGAEVYAAFRDWCLTSGYKPEGKKTFFDDLRAKHLLLGSATVGGHTVRNVVAGYYIDDLGL